jgi:hypothetical protein
MRVPCVGLHILTGAELERRLYQRFEEGRHRAYKMSNKMIANVLDENAQLRTLLRTSAGPQGLGSAPKR